MTFMLLNCDFLSDLPLFVYLLVVACFYVQLYVISML